MKHKDAQELKDKPLPELEKFLREGRERLRALKLDLAAGKVKNVGEIRELKRNIARASTFINMQSG